ncbi:MAG: symbB [Verrucomicrobiales bacterium]|nr:symbB [Verrucomicrobiales bacterium]
MASANEIQNCRVNFQCPKMWRGLKPTDDPKVRFCEYCFEQVHLVETEQELAAQSAHGRCVAILNLSPEHPGYAAEGLMGDIEPFKDDHVA